MVVDDARASVEIAFTQEAGARDDLPQAQLVDRSRFFHTHRVPFLRGTLTFTASSAWNPNHD